MIQCKRCCTIDEFILSLLQSFPSLVKAWRLYIDSFDFSIFVRNTFHCGMWIHKLQNIFLHACIYAWFSTDIYHTTVILVHKLFSVQKESILDINYRLKKWTKIFINTAYFVLVSLRSILLRNQQLQAKIVHLGSLQLILFFILFIRVC